MGSNITYTVNCNYRMAAVCDCVYPRNLLCFMYIIVNTLHKGGGGGGDGGGDDNDGNNNNNIIRDNGKGTCMLIDVAISGNINVIKKEAEKILKYKDLTTEIQRMWNVKTEVIPVAIGATGTIS